MGKIAKDIVDRRDELPVSTKGKGLIREQYSLNNETLQI